MSRKAYPRYKPSGVEWLGEIPEHWDIRKLKYISSIQFSNVDKHTVEGERPVLLCNYVDVYHHDFITADLNFMEATAPPGQIAKFALSAGDVIITKDSESWDDIAVPAYTSSDMHDVLCGYHLAQIRPNPKWAYGNYLFRAFCSRGVNDQFRVAATGITRYGLSKYWLDNGLFPVPPVNEQCAIAGFLDRETRRIDALIGKKQRQIELLQEKRAALISHAVTKGLDPTAKMKDSRVEWLGHVPAHWELKRLKFVAKIQTGLTLGKDYKNIPTTSRPYLRVANVQDGYLDLNEITEIFIPEEDTKRHELKQGDVLMTEGGDFDKLGRGYIWEGQIEGCLHQNHIFAVRPNPKYLASRYLATLMTSSYGKAYFTSTSQQTTNLATTNITKLKNYLLPLPDIREQGLILDWLGENISKSDCLIAKVLKSIDRLKEYRTAIISAAVTGKIDVRGEVRKAPAAFPRIVLAAEIVARLHNDPNFHRVKFQKVLYLCEHYLGMDLEGNYWRQAAGPLDNRMLHSLENQMQRQKWFATRRDGQKITYLPLEKAGGHRKYFDDYWAEYREGLDSLLELMRPLNTQQSEIVATLFAAWNDLTIAGLPFTDEDILHEVRNNWHESKERFDEGRLRQALQWMRDKRLVPQGLGKPTRTKYARK